MYPIAPELAKLSNKSFGKDVKSTKENGVHAGPLLDGKKRKCLTKNAIAVPNVPSGGILPLSVIRRLLALSPVVPYKKEQTKCY